MRRDRALDGVRGLAVLLMVLDHCLAMVGGGLLVRVTVTRASLPLFMLVAGWLLRDRDWPSMRRAAQLVGASLVASLLVVWLPFMASVDVLVVFVVALLFWPVARRWPVAALCVCLVVMSLAPRVWGGYHPAFVLALLLIGRSAFTESSGLRRFGEKLPASVCLVGRWPLSIYVGHLLILLGVFVTW